MLRQRKEQNTWAAEQTCWYVRQRNQNPELQLFESVSARQGEDSDVPVAGSPNYDRKGRVSESQIITCSLQLARFTKQGARVSRWHSFPLSLSLTRTWNSSQLLFTVRIPISPVVIRDDSSGWRTWQKLMSILSWTAASNIANVFHIRWMATYIGSRVFVFLYQYQIIHLSVTNKKITCSS